MMRTKLKPGDKAHIKGLIQRSAKNGRTGASNGQEGAGVVDRTTVSGGTKKRHSHNPRRVADGIHGPPRRMFYPSAGEALKYIVRDKVAEHSHTHPHPPPDDFPEKMRVRGQITRAVFEDTISVACKLYDIPGTETKDVVCTVYDFLGKKGDGRLLQTLQTKVSRNDLYATNTAAAVSDFMSEVRKGTLAHIEFQQLLLKSVIHNSKDFFQSRQRHDPSTVAKMLMVCGGDADGSSSISISAMKLQEELIDAGVGGEVYTSTVKRVAIDETLHNAYVNWLVHSVIPTLDLSDAKRKGNLMKWYRVPSWEQHLISAIVNTLEGDRIVLAVDDLNNGEDDDRGWLESCLYGFTSMDLSILSDSPGINVDRRIVRLAFFAQLVWNESLRCGAWDKLRKAKDDLLLQGEQESHVAASSFEPRGEITGAEERVDTFSESRVDTSSESKAVSSSANEEEERCRGAPVTRSLLPSSGREPAKRRLLETIDKRSIELLNTKTRNSATGGGDDFVLDSSSSLLVSFWKSSRQREREDCSSVNAVCSNSTTSAKLLKNHRRTCTSSMLSKTTTTRPTQLMVQDDEHSNRKTCMNVSVVPGFFFPTNKKKTMDTSE
jgi:hypothetical protein